MRAWRVVGGLVVVALAAGAPGAGAARTLTLSANGLDGVAFGAPARSVTTALTAALGAGASDATPEEAACGVTRTVSWGELVVDVRGAAFVGYSDGPAGAPVAASTKAGLRVGLSLAAARRLYPALVTSSAQGGSYRVATPAGAFAGFLSAEARTGRARIASVGAGVQGCPAMSP